MVEANTTITFESAFAVFHEALSGNVRHEIVRELTAAKSFADALARLRAAMHSNTFKTSTTTLNLDKTIRALDNRTRQDGFHVLHDWDGKASKLNKDTIPVDVLNYLAGVLVRNAAPNEA